MHTLRDAYHTTFHPDPDIHIPGSVPVDPRLYANTHLADRSTLLSAPFGNCSATYLILNSAQHVALHDLIANVEDILHLAYLIPTALPSVINRGEVKEVSLSTFPLPNDARKITSPIPFAVYLCCAFADHPSLFLHNYYKFYNNHNSSILSLSQPPCEESSALFLTSPPSSKPAVETTLNLASAKK